MTKTVEVSARSVEDAIQKGLLELGIEENEASIEVINEGETGFMVPLGDTDATAEKALQLLTNPTKWKQFSEAATQSVYRKFASEKIAAQYEALYEKVLGENNEGS